MIFLWFTKYIIKNQSPCLQRLQFNSELFAVKFDIKYNVSLGQFEKKSWIQRNNCLYNMRLHIIIFIYCIISMPVKCKKIILNAFTFPHFFFFIFHLIYFLFVFCESSQNWTKNQTELLKLLALPIKRQQRWNKHSHWAQRIERSTKVCFFLTFFFG